MIKRKKFLNSKMRDIINILHKRGGLMSAHEIAEETGIAYITVKKYLKILEEQEVIIKDGEENYQEN